MASIDSPRLSSPYVDDGGDRPGVKHYGGEAYPERAGGLTFSSFAPRLQFICWEVSFREVVMPCSSIRHKPCHKDREPAGGGEVANG